MWRQMPQMQGLNRTAPQHAESCDVFATAKQALLSQLCRIFETFQRYGDA
jgi:hypothetical protein